MFVKYDRAGQNIATYHKFTDIVTSDTMSSSIHNAIYQAATNFNDSRFFEHVIYSWASRLDNDRRWWVNEELVLFKREHLGFVSSMCQSM